MRNILMLEKHDVFFWHASGSVSVVLPSAYILWCGLQQAERQARTEGDHWGRVQMDPQQDVHGSINIAPGSGPLSNRVLWNESWAFLVLSPQKLRTRIWSVDLNGSKKPTEDQCSLLITMNISDTRGNCDIQYYVRRLQWVRCSSVRRRVCRCGGLSSCVSPSTPQPAPNDDLSLLFISTGSLYFLLLPQTLLLGR